jgi:hypothetical protein
MEFIFAKEFGTNVNHMTHKHGTREETVKAVFHLAMRDWQDGNHRVRICKANKRGDMLRVAYDWIKVNEAVKIYSAYYWYP